MQYKNCGWENPAKNAKSEIYLATLQDENSGVALHPSTPVSDRKAQWQMKTF